MTSSTNGYPVGTPLQQILGTVGNPANTQNSDASPAAPYIDHNGALLYRNLGGQRLAAAVRGNVYAGGSLVAGILPVTFAAGTTLATTAGLVNPAGSGKNVELIAVSVANITHVIAGTPVVPHVLGVQINASTTGAVPSSITKQPTISTPFGLSPGVTPVGFTYSAETLNFSAGHEVFDALLYPWGNPETAIGTYGGTVYFDGEVVLAPDSNISLVTTAAYTANPAVQVTWLWSEWLP